MSNLYGGGLTDPPTMCTAAGGGGGGVGKFKFDALAPPECVGLEYGPVLWCAGRYCPLIGPKPALPRDCGKPGAVEGCLPLAEKSHPALGARGGANEPRLATASGGGALERSLPLPCWSTSTERGGGGGAGGNGGQAVPRTLAEETSSCKGALEGVGLADFVLVP